MDYIALGRTGLKVSRLCLGMMTYGSKNWRPWVLNEEEGQPIIKVSKSYRPVGSIRHSGLFLVYEYRFQLCGSQGFPLFISGSGLRNRPMLLL